MNDNTPELWLLITSLLFVSTWICAEVLQRAPRWITRLRRLQAGRQAMATEYASRQRYREVVGADSTGG